MFTSLTFHNLRCFKDFTLENITPLTLLSGRNNVGKTTVLEGIYLSFGFYQAEILLQINNAIRGMEFSTITPQRLFPGQKASDIWKSFFTDMDMSQQLTIAMHDSTGKVRRLTLGKDTEVSFAAHVEHNGLQPVLVPDQGSDSLRFFYEDGIVPDVWGRYYFTQNGLTVQFDTPSSRIFPWVSYTGPGIRASQQWVAEYLGRVEQEGKKEQLVAALQLLYEEIEDIFIVPQQGVNTIVARLHTKKPLPLRALGDGINKLLTYLSLMIAYPGGIFLFDEIENGFHYSFYPKLWELIAKVAQETENQVFATTHSYECIEASLEGVSKVDRDLLTYVRLGKEDIGIVPYAFVGEDLAYALEHDMEIR